MSMLSINTNIMALRTGNAVGNNYSQLAVSSRRLASGLRVSTAADDAAGLAVRELMRSDITVLQQGIRNTNDAISMIQTADGALAVIDEKLIRMKELAEQAATGTYNSVQRLIIDSEFQAMGNEIDRIANSTDFNGITLLNGNLSGLHDGSGLQVTGAMKIHFGAGNDSAEDYYYVDIADATTNGLGLTDGAGGAGAAGIGENIGNVPVLGDVFTNGSGHLYRRPGERPFVIAVIPKGAKNVKIDFSDSGVRDSLQLFTPSGKHVLGTILNSLDWRSQGNAATGNPVPPLENWAFLPGNGFNAGATYDGSGLNGIGGDLTYTPGTAGNAFTYNGMNIGYSGSGNFSWGAAPEEYMTIDEVTEDLIFCIAGDGPSELTSVSWTAMPAAAGGGGGGGDGALMSIKTQELAQQGLKRIDSAIATKDNIRSHLGALQNRLENTATNLQTQAENLQAAESRISDVDVATEMTTFVRSQILTQSAVAMLTQANSMPKMLMNLLQG